MTSIPEYSAQLYDGEIVEIGGDDDNEPLEVIPPEAGNVDAGAIEGVTAAETVELHRALSAWLGMHRKLHTAWHDAYRTRDPGGRVVPVEVGEFVKVLNKHLPEPVAPRTATEILRDMRARRWLRLPR